MAGKRETTYHDPDSCAACWPRRRAARRRRVLPPRSARDQQGPGRRQHRRLRVRQPGRTRHGHDHRQLRARSRARPAGRTSTSSATTSSTRSTSTTTATARPTSRTSSSSGPTLHEPGHVPLQHRADHVARQTRTGTGGSSTVTVSRASTTTTTATSTTAAGKSWPSDLPSPPCNIGPRSTPNYDALAEAAVHDLPSGETVFAGQRNDGFFVDLGAIFDLGDLRPFQNLHLIPTPPATGVDALADAQRAHDRDPGADPAADAGRLGARPTR